MADLSYQLYSSRDFPPLNQTLRMVADLGYRQVEGYGALYASLADLDGLKGILSETGLEMTSGHVGLDMIERDPAKVIDICGALGMMHVFVPFVGPSDRPDDADGWRQFGIRLAAAAQPLIDAGLRFGWHNHDFEFRSLPDGSYPIEALLDGGTGIGLEMDVAWVVRAGENADHWIERLSNRIVAAHVKDIAPEGENTDEDGWADVGHGRMDWRGLMASLRQTGCDLFVVEHDKPSDDARFAKRSIAFLNDL